MPQSDLKRRPLTWWLALGWVAILIVWGCDRSDRQARPLSENQAPLAIEDRFGLVAGTQRRMPVLENDTDPDGDELHVTAVTQPDNLTVGLNPDGSLTCQVGHSVHGVVIFEYTIDDGHGATATAKVFVEVMAAVDILSRAWHGLGANDGSWLAAVDGVGNRVAFASRASDLVLDDTNDVADIFIYDFESGSLRCVSRADGNRQADGESFWPSIDANGRYVAFCSHASNLVSPDTNGVADVFVVDCVNQQIQRVSVSSQGDEAEKACVFPAISADGRWVAFFSEAANLVPRDGNNSSDVFIHDRATGTTRRVSVSSDGQEGNGSSAFPALSGDGRQVSFQSVASNLVAADTNAVSDIFVHDCLANTTRCVSGPGDGTGANGRAALVSALSASGRYVVFQSMASNLTAGDTNNTWDIFRCDLQTYTHRRISLNSDGTELLGAAVFPAVDATGRFVVFQSSSVAPQVGATGVGDNIFIHDCHTGNTRCVSLNVDGNPADGSSLLPTISADGRFTVFESQATDLVAEDSNGSPDIFRVPNPAAL